MLVKKKKYLTKAQLAKRLAAIEALILDVDGVLTDDSLYMGPDGFEMKRFNIGDGLNMVLAMRAGLEVIIVSNRHSEATASRMRDLKIKHVVQDHGNKHRLLTEYMEKSGLNIDLAKAAFIGNDIMDIPLMKQVGLKIAVADSYPDLIDMVDYVSSKKGGRGAVREVIDLYFKGRGLNPADFVTK
jgi:3-deoxy-D-manno-octulosonate 8-phosphate phosphatase (KDO 8-P phosphatase)